MAAAREPWNLGLTGQSVVAGSRRHGREPTTLLWPLRNDCLIGRSVVASSPVARKPERWSSRWRLWPAGNAGTGPRAVNVTAAPAATWPAPLIRTRSGVPPSVGRTSMIVSWPK